MLELEVVTPSRTALHEPVRYVVVPSTEGRYGILPHHAPMVVALGRGVLHYGQGERRLGLVVEGGICELSGRKATILTEVALLPEDIDVRAEQEKRAEAEALLTQGGTPAQIAEARGRLAEALARLEIIE